MTVHLIQLDIPANTAKTALVSESRTVTKGELLSLSLDFPDGCKGLVYARVLLDGSQFWPIDLDVFFRGNAKEFTFPESKKLTKDHNLITLEGYNLDDTYMHQLQLSFSVVPEESLLVRFFGGLSLPVVGTPGMLERK